MGHLPIRSDNKSRIENITPQPKPDITVHVEPEQIVEPKEIEVKNLITDETEKLNEVYVSFEK